MLQLFCMRLRIVRPRPATFEGFDLGHLKFGAAHDVNSPLCDLLLAASYAVPEDLLPPPDPASDKRESVSTKS